MVHHGDETMVIQFDEFGKGLAVVLADAQHEADIRIAERQLVLDSPVRATPPRHASATLSNRRDRGGFRSSRDTLSALSRQPLVRTDG